MSEEKPDGTPGAPTDGGDQGSAAAVDPMDELRAERDKLKDQLLRTAADLDNTRKRSRREVEEARNKGREDAVRELLPVFDNLERAAAHATDAADSKAIADGIQMVMRLFEEQLGRLGVTRIKAIGERFDPSFHDALQQVDSDQPAGTVVAEIQPGYRCGERLVRAATVVVARPKAEPPKTETPAGQQS